MFPTGYINAPGKVGGGEIYGGSHVILGMTSFEDGLVVGRFAKIDTGRLDNLDSSATPVLAGVVQREVSQPLDDNGVIDAAYTDNVHYVTQGLVTVDGTVGETPTRGAAIYAINASGSGANFGKATITTTNNVLTNAKFVDLVQSGVWLVQLA